MSKLNLGDSLILDSDIVVNGGEVKTGATFNGKPVYRKWVSGTYNSNYDWSGINTGIVNGTNAHIVDGWGVGDSSNYPLNFYFNSGADWAYAGVNDSGSNVYLMHHESHLSGRTAYVCIEYTKTTD